MDWCFWIGTIIFLATYILIASEKVHKVICALGGAALMFIFVLHKEHGTAEKLTGAAAEYAKLDVWARYVNFDVVFTLCGMMILVNILSTTGLFQYVAIKCAKLAKGSPIKMMILLSLATAFMSAFLDIYSIKKDPLLLAKACTLADMITRMQNKESGLIPTHWMRKTCIEDGGNLWINCMILTANSMLDIAEITEKEELK